MKPINNEHGAAALELAMLAPVIILLTSLMVDACTFLVTVMQADGISTEAAHYVMNRSASDIDDGSFRQAIKESFPDEEEKGLSIDATLVMTSSTREQFIYPLYSGGELKELATEENYDSYLVSVTIVREWPVFGRVLNGENGSFTVTARKYCEADNMQESPWNTI